MTERIKKEVEELKTKGNECLKSNKYQEAILHYTDALKLTPCNHLLYSNRSLAFFKIQQYYHSLEDAEKAIDLRPEWAKGYYRKGEVELATFNFTKALASFKKALELQGGQDQIIEAAIERATVGKKQDKKGDVQIPWLGAGFGIIVGATLVIADHVFRDKPSMSNPLLKTVFTMLIAVIGYALGSIYRQYIRMTRLSLLKAPVDLLKEFEEQVKNSNKEETTHSARFRQTKQNSSG